MLSPIFIVPVYLIWLLFSANNPTPFAPVVIDVDIALGLPDAPCPSV